MKNTNIYLISLFTFVLLSTSAFAECAKQRTIVISNNDYPLVGFDSYKQSLPLREKEIVLTFDDGPHSNTRKVLKILNQYCLKATFFVVGKMAESNPEILREIYLSGHNIANHSYSHSLFDRISSERQIFEIERTQEIVKNIIGNNMIPVFRFPGLARTKETENYLFKNNLSVWSVDIDTKDYMFSKSETNKATYSMIARINKGLERQNYGVILMHDIHNNSANALSDILNYLISNGYTFVHVKFEKNNIFSKNISYEKEEKELSWPLSCLGLNENPDFPIPLIKCKLKF